ncbi:hypothetical protein DPMN_039721, partial [Dreissena polymorpha]
MSQTCIGLDPWSSHLVDCNRYQEALLVKVYAALPGSTTKDCIPQARNLSLVVTTGSARVNKRPVALDIRNPDPHEILIQSSTYGELTKVRRIIIP